MVVSTNFRCSSFTVNCSVPAVEQRIVHVRLHCAANLDPNGKMRTRGMRKNVGLVFDETRDAGVWRIRDAFSNEVIWRESVRWNKIASSKRNLY